MVQAIHTSVKGRARYKIKGLRRSEPLKRHIESRLSEKKEIIGLSANILTGNILVFFNSKNDSNTIASLIRTVVEEYKAVVDNKEIKQRTLDQKQKTENRQTFSRRKLRRLIISAEDQITHSWHTMEPTTVLNLLGVDKKCGLSSKMAEENLKRYGPNILPESVPRSGISILMEQFKSIPVALLGVAAGISIFTGGIADAVVIIGVVAINAVIGYVTESQAEKTIHSLKNLVSPLAAVIRDGLIKEIGVENITPGDILVLKPGTYVSADARLIEANHLSVDESTLTGENMPVLKMTESLQVKAINHTDIPLADRTNMVYMGTLVTGGYGIAVVVATGRFTEIGKIQALVGETRPPETTMERQLNRIGKQLVLIGVAICGMVFLLGLMRGYRFLQMLKTSVSLAVAAVPEGLPTVATTTLALGIKNMRRYNVLIRHLDAVETLGSIQTICLDKTGTITLNKMSVVEVYTGMRRFGFHDGRFVTSEDDNHVIHYNEAFKNYKRHYISPYFYDELLKLIYICILCNESVISKNINGYTVNGSPTENALIYAAISLGIDIFMAREKFPLLKIQHRSENCNYMVTIHNIKINNKDRHGKIVAIKGSPNEVLSLCSFHLSNGNKIRLTEDDIIHIEKENERMAGNALRVLGVAYAFIDDVNLSEDILNPEFLRQEIEFIWLGLIGMADPIRDGAKELISAFHKAGIDTIMITGDQSPTAYAIAKELNVSKGEQIEILDSTHLKNIEPEVMKAICKRVHVFSRVSPSHKLRIVQSLQSAGRVVAMTGDGINDGPALKAADIGIAMGSTGTDVAREVADMVLQDDNLETMIIAISQGRTIYNNIRKSVHFLLSTNLSEILVMFAAIAGGLGQPLSAMQLLWINLISDIAPGLALAVEPPEYDVLSRPPRAPDCQIIRSSDFKRITFESAALSAGALGAYGYGIARYGMGPRAGTLAFMSLTISQLLHAISCRSEKHSIFDKEKMSPNKYLNFALAGSMALQVFSIAIPGLRSLLGISPIGLIDAVVIGGSAVIPMLINESTKDEVRNEEELYVYI